MSTENKETIADILAAKRESEATCEKTPWVGNAAAMREALENVRCYLLLQYMRLHRENTEGGGYYERILDVVNSALSAPPRNCDVGTPDEQCERHNRWCYHERNKECAAIECVLCFAKWAQMPYEKGGAK